MNHTERDPVDITQKQADKGVEEENKDNGITGASHLRNDLYDRKSDNGYLKQCRKQIEPVYLHEAPFSENLLRRTGKDKNRKTL